MDWFVLWNKHFSVAFGIDRIDYSAKTCTFGIILVIIFLHILNKECHQIISPTSNVVRVKEQFDVNLIEETVEMVRGGASNSNSPPTSNSSPDSPYSSVSNAASNSMMSTPAGQELAAIWRCYCHLMDEINNVTHSLGKDGKFQLFICLSLR